MVRIKNWFLENNFTSAQRQLIAEGNMEQIGESEKAVRISVTADNGSFTFWCPKSCLCDEPEKLTAEQLEELRNDDNMVRMSNNGHTIIVKKSEVKMYKMMGFKVVK